VVCIECWKCNQTQNTRLGSSRDSVSNVLDSYSNVRVSYKHSKISDGMCVFLGGGVRFVALFKIWRTKWLGKGFGIKKWEMELISEGVSRMSLKQGEHVLRLPFWPPERTGQYGSEQKLWPVTQWVQIPSSRGVLWGLLGLIIVDLECRTMFWLSKIRLAFTGGACTLFSASTACKDGYLCI
jgi:hypothetical protein